MCNDNVSCCPLSDAQISYRTVQSMAMKLGSSQNPPGEKTYIREKVASGHIVLLRDMPSHRIQILGKFPKSLSIIAVNGGSLVRLAETAFRFRYTASILCHGGSEMLCIGLQSRRDTRSRIKTMLHCNENALKEITSLIRYFLSASIGQHGAYKVAMEM